MLTGYQLMVDLSLAAHHMKRVVGYVLMDDWLSIEY